MLHRRVLFDTPAPQPAVDPVRMDVAVFIGFLAPKSAPAISEAQKQVWAREGFLTKQEEADGRVQPIVDKPIALQSADQLDSYFEPDRRVDQECELLGGAVLDALPAVENRLPLSVVIDGEMFTVDWPEDAAHLTAVVEVFQAALPQIDIALKPSDTGVRLRIARDLRHGATTLSVVGHRGLGFETTQHARAQSVGAAMRAAIRHFFANGGTRAYVVSMGAALPVFVNADTRRNALAQLLAVSEYAGGALVPLMGQDLPPAHIETAQRTAITQLYGLDDAALLVLPDVPELVCVDRRTDVSVPQEPETIAGFSECVSASPVPERNHLAKIDLPVCDADGASLWTAVIQRVLRLIARARRDVMVLAGLPQTKSALGIDIPDSAFLQVAQPWVRCVESADLPAAAMGADAVLAAQIARILNSDTPYNSAASEVIAGVRALKGRSLHQPLCNTLVQGPYAVRLDQDHTASSDQAWTQATASRIAARLIRMSQMLGQTIVFDPVSDRLMLQISRSFSQALQSMAAQGALYATPDDPGYSVLCDRTVNTADDRASGRLNCHVSFRPSSPIEWISINLAVRAA